MPARGLTPPPNRVRWHRRGIDAHAAQGEHRGVDNENWPGNPLALSALVGLAINDIEMRDARDWEVLLQVFLQTAWPSSRAARQ